MLSCLRLNRVAVLLLSIVTGNCTADGSVKNWEFNGFITQGYFESDHNNFNGKSSSGSTDFREIAVNSAWRISGEVLLAGQVMSRRAGKVDDGDPRMDYLLLDYRFHETGDGFAGLRVGRIKNPFGFYNTTRDVAFTRPSIVLPQSLYFDKARDLELSADGAMLYGRHLLNEGWVESGLIIGKPHKDVSVEYAYLNYDWPGEFDDSRGFLWRSEYIHQDYSFRAGFTYGQFELDFDVDGTPALGAPGDGTVEIDIASFSLQYNLERLSFTGEYMQQFIEWGSLGGIYGLDPKNTSESAYLQAEYRLSSSLSAFLRYDVLYIDKDDRSGNKAAMLFGRPNHTQFAKDWTLGIGWEPDEHWMLRAEWHKVQGTAWLAVQDNPSDVEREERWNMFSLQATYRF